MTIAIKTRLYRATTVTVRNEWNTNARNLLVAAKALGETREATERANGNIGCGATWLEIDGQVIDPMELTGIIHGDDPRDPMPWTRTRHAQALLADVASGAYADRVAAMRAAAQEE